MKKINQNLLSCLLLLTLVFFFIGCSESSSRAVPGPSEPKPIPREPFAIIDTIKEDTEPVNPNQSDYYIFEPSDWQDIDGIKDTLPNGASIEWYTKNWDKNLFEISSSADLRGLAWLVNKNIDDFRGKTIKVKDGVTEIDVSDSYWIPIGEGMPEFTVGNFEKNNLLGFSGKAIPTEWEKNLDVAYRFCGTFDGNGVTINGLTNKQNGNQTSGYYSRSENWFRFIIEKDCENIAPGSWSVRGFSYGLFGIVQGIVNDEGAIVGGIIKNLNMSEVDIELPKYFIDGILYSGRKVVACFPRSIGSVVGTGVNNVLLENINIKSGNILTYSGNASYNGGIIGSLISKTTAASGNSWYSIEPSNNDKSLFKIKNCVNEALTVKAFGTSATTGIYSGGILGGVINGNGGELFIYETENMATIGDESLYIEKPEFQSGSIPGTIGGIIGGAFSLSRVVLVDISNEGELVGHSQSSLGGIVGRLSLKNIDNLLPSVLYKCRNKGDILSKNPDVIGGIAGYISFSTLKNKQELVVSDLSNEGKIIGGAFYAGGLIGRLYYFHNVDMRNCYVGNIVNDGNAEDKFVEISISEEEYKNDAIVGGLIGVFDRSASLYISDTEINLKNLDWVISNTDTEETAYPSKSGLVVGTLYTPMNTNGQTNYDFRNVRVCVENAKSDQVSKIRTIGNALRKTENDIFKQYFTESGKSTLVFEDDCTVTYRTISNEGSSESNVTMKLKDIKYEAAPEPKPAETPEAT